MKSWHGHRFRQKKREAELFPWEIEPPVGTCQGKGKHCFKTRGCCPRPRSACAKGAGAGPSQAAVRRRECRVECEEPKLAFRPDDEREASVRSVEWDVGSREDQAKSDESGLVFERMSRSGSGRLQAVLLLVRGAVETVAQGGGQVDQIGGEGGFDAKALAGEGMDESQGLSV